MEFNFSRLFAGISINIFDLNDLWYILDNLNQSVNLVNFNEIDNLLLEEFNQLAVHFSLKFRILQCNSLEVCC